MQILKFIVSLIITLGIVYALDSRWMIGNNAVPPLGKFLDPFHGFWQNIEPEDYTFPEELNIRGLKDKATVVFDSLMIPHIFATNDEDLYLAQGYVTAMHRLWQMEFQTHAGAGRISEILGKNEAFVDYDRRQRRLGMVYGAENALKGFQSDPVSKMIIEKYSEGVNRYIETLAYKNLPLEYKLLDYRPEPWTEIKCALLLKNMAQTLNIGNKDIEMTNALQLFGKEMVDVLYPDFEGVDDPVVNKPGNWNFNPVKIDTVGLALPDELINVKKLSANESNIGSNNWAVSGSKTSTGSPILCGDPHLNLSLPSIWYAIQLHSPSVNVMGVSFPGAPCVIIGFNDSIAWSPTNADRDLVDWFKITFEDKNKNRYFLDNEWTETKKVIEEFKIRGAPTFYDTVIYTHWGPVTYDENFHGENNRRHYAFRWIAHDVSNEMLTFYKLNHARNFDDYSDALNHFLSPAQNFAFASVAGDIAMRVQGKFPVRRKNEGKFILDGSKRSNGWQAFIPNEQNVMEKNPERGFVSSANQYPVDVTYPYYITASSYEAYRNRRINKVLGGSDNIKASDMMKLQNDNYNLKAVESLPTFLQQLDTTAFTPEQARGYQILKQWDYFNHKDSEGASYYEALWDFLLPLLWDEMNNPSLALKRPSSFTTIKLLKERPDFIFFDVSTTEPKETAADVIRKAFELAVESIEKWKAEHNTTTVYWADYKDSYMTHLLRLAPFNVHARAGGNDGIVNAHTRTHGPSWRMIVSLEKSGVKCWATYPGGQSGNAGSKYYANMMKHWVDGKYFPLLFMHTTQEKSQKIISSIQLNP